VTWNENQPTASHDVREAIKYLMDDLKAAIVLGSQPQYIDELYCSIGIPLPSDGVTIQTIREDFRKYDQRMKKEATLVEIVLQLKPLTTAAGFKTHKSITRYLKALDDCKRIPGLPSSFEYYQDQFRKFTGIVVPSDPTKSDLWPAFSKNDTDKFFPAGLVVNEAMNRCEWITYPTAWENYLKTGTPGHPQSKPIKKQVQAKKPSQLNLVTFKPHQIGICDQCESTMTQKQMDFIEAIKAAKPNVQGVQVGKQKQKVEPRAKVLESRADVVNVAPKRKFNLE